MMLDWVTLAILSLVVLVVLGALVWAAVARSRRVAREQPRSSELAPPATPPPESVAPVEEHLELPEPVEVAPAPPVEAPPAVAPVALEQRLSRTRGALATALGRLFGKGGASRFTSEEWDEAEEGLLAADVGLGTAQAIVGAAKERAKGSNGTGLKDLLKEECIRLFESVPSVPVPLDKKPYVISIVGVNGVGKTTTIGKLASRFAGEGRSVLLAAGDTFRAGAISQLKVWAERSGSQFVAGREGGDPGAVAFDALTAAKARGVEVVLVDTAGRLHTKVNLMDELKKVHKVMKKVIPDAPHQTWLVLDGTLGQNSLRQAREFQSALELSGIILTKLDGTAKGGAALAVASEMKLPIRYIGVGEGVEDLVPFEPSRFVSAILA